MTWWSSSKEISLTKNFKFWENLNHTKKVTIWILKVHRIKKSIKTNRWKPRVSLWSLWTEPYIRCCNSGIEFLVTRKNPVNVIISSINSLNFQIPLKKNKRRIVSKMTSKSDVWFTLLTNPGAPVWYVKQLQMKKFMFGWILCKCNAAERLLWPLNF